MKTNLNNRDAAVLIAMLILGVTSFIVGAFSEFGVWFFFLAGLTLGLPFTMALVTYIEDGK